MEADCQGMFSELGLGAPLPSPRLRQTQKEANLVPPSRTGGDRPSRVEAAGEAARRGQTEGGDPGRAVAAPPSPTTATAADLTVLPSLQRGGGCHCHRFFILRSSLFLQLSGRVAVQLLRQLQAGERTMRAVLALLALIASLLLFLCLARLPADGAGGASGWEQEGRAATDFTPKVMRYLRSPTHVHLAAPLVPNRAIPNPARVQKSEQASKCKDIWSNNWSSSIKKKSNSFPL